MSFDTSGYAAEQAERRRQQANGAASEQDKARDPGTLCLTPAQWAARDIPLQDRLLGDLFSTTTRTQLSADTGLGKTMFGLATAFAKRLGANFLHWQGHRQASVLYVDGEMPGEPIKDRLAMAGSWFGLETPLADGFHLSSREDVEDMPVSFTLKFPKCRRRTPDNRTDFDPIEVTLERGQWSYNPAETPNGSKNKLPDCAQLCLDALHKAIDELGQAPPSCSATTGVRLAVKLDQWRDMFRRIAPYADDQAEARKKAFQRGTERLSADRIATKWGDWVWLGKP